MASDKAQKPDDTNGSDAIPVPLISLDQTTVFTDSTPPQEGQKENQFSTPMLDTDGKPSGKKSGGSSGVRSIAGYSLVQLIGQGGMGRVYKSVDGTGHSFAVKLLSPDLSRSKEALERFKQEGKVASAINHPHCVFVHRADEEGGVPFIVMELMTGENLKDYVSRRGPLPYREAVRLILQCAEGLMEAHARGMIHRDIKPGNCFMDDDGNVKIGDFGLARSLVGDSELTQTGAFLGTPLYSSPEQLLGEPIDERSDIYSMAATLYFLLAGKAPFESPNAPQVIAKIVSSDSPPLRDRGVKVPKALEQIVLKGLSRDRSKRYATMAEFRDQLLPLISNESETATLPRRLLAFAVDYTLIHLVISAPVFWLAAPYLQYRETTRFTLLTGLLSDLVIFVYYLLTEWLWAASPGKKLINLRLQDRKSGGPPSLLQVLARTSLYILLFNFSLIFFALYAWATGSTSPENSGGYVGSMASLGAVLGNLLLISTWWFTGKKQLLHEWLSGTETRAYSYRREFQQVRLEAQNWNLPTRAIDSGLSIPDRFGRFDIQGRIDTTDDSLWLAGFDKSIERAVWIRLVPKEKAQQPLEAARMQERRACVRKSRMRFVESGVLGDQVWDAFVGPEGLPLPLWFDKACPMPWPVTRQMLKDVLDEMQAEESRLPVSAFGPEQLWLDEFGKLVVSDVAVRLDSGQKATTPTNTAEVFQGIANHALPDSHSRARSRQPVPLKRVAGFVPPWNATRMLLGLKKKKFSDLDRIQAELNAAGQGPQTVTVAKRLVHAAVLSLVLAIPAILGLLLTILPPILFADQFRSDSEKLVSLAEVLREPGAYKKAFSQVPESHQARMAEMLRPGTIGELEVGGTTRQEQFEKCYGYLGLFERTLLNGKNDFLGGGDLMELPKPVVASLRDDHVPKSKEAREVKRTMWIMGNRVTGLNDVDRDPQENLVSMMDAMERWKGDPKGNLAAARISVKIFSMLSVVGFLFLGLALWGGITFGGLTHLVSGLSVVKRDGRRPGFLASFLRSLIFWAPPALVVLAIVLVDVQSIEALWWAQQLRRAFLVLPLAYLLVVIRWPMRGPHDWVSGTYVVPRWSRIF